MAHEPNLRAVVFDRIASKVIPAGGMLIVACVLGILVFLIAVTIPLILPAKAKAAVVLKDGGGCLALDFIEGLGQPWWVTRDGAWKIGEDGRPARIQLPGYDGARPVAAAQAGTSRSVAILFEDGRIALVRVEKKRDGNVGVAVLDEQSVSPPAPCEIAAARDDEGHARIAVLRDHVVTVCGPAGLAGTAETPLEAKAVVAVALAGSGKLLALALKSGEIEIWNVEDAAEPLRVQNLPPGPAPRTALAFLLGDETLLAADERGSVIGWMKARHVKLANAGAAEARVLGDAIPPGGSVIVLDRDHSKHVPKGGPVTISTGGNRFVPAREFPVLPAAARVIAVSPRNKCFAVGDAAGGVSVFHATSENLSLAIPPPAPMPSTRVAFGPTGEELSTWTDGLRSWTLRNPHPDVTAASLLAPIWYESYTGPELIWQSSSGTQDSEPKYSLWPLLAGTLKGTLYALLFSVPISLAAAIYVARFAPAKLRSWVKPSIELMAGIPSVVVGMIAALWLAPVVERLLCAILVGGLLLPCVFAAVVSLSGRIPRRPDRHPVAGVEIGGAVLVILITCLLAALLQGSVERIFFRGDLRQWLFDVLHVTYDIRNGFLVGIALGFAVIPVIFTIAEDAIANVPASMTSAALALGATRWQTVRHVILPAAASGLFAAIILGLGRAAGETMIVVMAAGNTPILDPAPWNGMRTLSAAMAIEIPEAPVNGSLYRVLFLTGLLLFAFTASLNTVAELVGSRLRRKYGRV